MAIWDIFFAWSLFSLYFLNSGTICDIIISLQLIFQNFSLACTAVLSSFILAESRIQQEYLLHNHGKYLSILYVISIFNGVATLATSIPGNFNLLEFLIQYILGGLLIFFIAFCNLKLLYMLIIEGFQIPDKTPMYLSMGLLSYQLDKSQI
jgi:hypothetical protein